MLLIYKKVETNNILIFLYKNQYIITNQPTTMEQKRSPLDRYNEAKVPDRCLAKVVKVQSIEPIKETNNLLLANIGGYNVIVNKNNNFEVNSLGVYFFLDAVLNPEQKEFAFLEGKPLKTKKLFGVLSQGLLMPMKICEGLTKEELKEGVDVTTLLQVKKYIHPAEMIDYKDMDSSRAPFPSNFPKTDEQRVQEDVSLIQRLVGLYIVITRKEDGCSTSYYFLNGTFLICGRNNVLLTSEKGVEHYFDMNKKYSVEEKMRKYNKNMAIQGEIVGPKINGNKMDLKEKHFKVFNIYLIDEHRYACHDEVKQICSDLGLQTVPILFEGKMDEKNLNLPYFLEMANNLTYESVGKKVLPAEGIVVKTHDRRISFKVISNVFLLKYK